MKLETSDFNIGNKQFQSYRRVTTSNIIPIKSEERDSFEVKYFLIQG